MDNENRHRKAFRVSAGDVVEIHGLEYRYLGWGRGGARFSVGHDPFDVIRLDVGERRTESFIRDGADVVLIVKRIDGDVEFHVDAPQHVPLRLVG